MISWARILTSTACLNAAVSNPPSSLRNFIKLSEARLQKVLSSELNSPHGLVALIRPLLGRVFHAFFVASKSMAGGPPRHEASAGLPSRQLAPNDSPTSPTVTQRV